MILKKDFSNKMKLLFYYNLQVVDYLWSHTFWTTCLEYIKNEENNFNGNFFLEKNYKCFFLKSVWGWHNLFALFYQFARFRDVWFCSFFDWLLRMKRKLEKNISKENFFQSAVLEFRFVFLSIRTFSTFLATIIFGLGAWEMVKIPKRIFQQIKKKKSSWKKVLIVLFLEFAW